MRFITVYVRAEYRYNSYLKIIGYSISEIR